MPQSIKRALSNISLILHCSVKLFAEHLSSNPEFFTPCKSRDKVKGWMECTQCMSAPKHGSYQFFCTVLPLTPSTRTHKVFPHPHANTFLSSFKELILVYPLHTYTESLPHSHTNIQRINIGLSKLELLFFFNLVVIFA